MTTAERRRLRALAERASPDIKAALLSLAGPPKAVKPEKRQRLAAKKETRAAATERTAAVRKAVFDRATLARALGGFPGDCEFCRGRLATEFHHTFQGAQRKTREAPETCAAICEDCHRAYHGALWWALDRARAWANRCGFHAARAEIEHRLEKREARAPRAAGATP